MFKLKKMNRFVLSSLLYFLSGSIFANDMTRFTSKERALMTTAGGCAAGLAVGAYFSSDPESDKGKTIASNALIGCVTGAIFSWVFQDDDQKKLVSENINLQNKIAEYERKLTSNSLENSSIPVEKRSLSSLNLPDSLNKLKLEGCKAVEFSLGMSGRYSRFIPVSDQVVVESFKYYLILPEDGTDRECVDSRYGFLNREFRNFDKILIDKAMRSKPQRRF